MSKFYIILLILSYCFTIVADEQSFPVSTTSATISIGELTTQKSSAPAPCSSTNFQGVVQLVYMLVISTNVPKEDFKSIIELMKSGPKYCFENPGSDVQLITQNSKTGPINSYANWQQTLKGTNFAQISKKQVIGDKNKTLSNAAIDAAKTIGNTYTNPSHEIIILTDFCSQCSTNTTTETKQKQSSFCKSCENLIRDGNQIMSFVNELGLPIIFFSLDSSTTPIHKNMVINGKNMFGMIPNLTSCTQIQTTSVNNLETTLHDTFFPCRRKPPEDIGSNAVAISLGTIGFIVFLLICCMFFCYLGKRLHWRATIMKMRLRNERISRIEMNEHHDPIELSHIENEIKEKHKRKKRKSTERYKDLHELTEVAAAHGVHECSRSGDAWELQRERLTVYFNEKLGSGAFCNVYKGYIIGRAPVTEIEHIMLASKKFEDCEAAVKMLPDYADYSAKSDFQQEINFMKQLGYHPHLMSLLACVTIDSPLCLVTEYCAKGDLLKIVRTKKTEILGKSSEDSNCLGFRDLLSFSWQISDGLTFLSSKGCIHRDVAARNILVTESNTAKIGDFGLCRNVDQSVYTTRGGRLPIKWMSYESLIHYEYTTQSDVWSFGVLLYEIFSLGEVPYPTVQPADMIDHLKSGNRMGKPEECSDDIYEVMMSCWSENPQRRPTFEQLRERLSSILENTTEQYGYISFSEASDQMVIDDNDSEV